MNWQFFHCQPVLGIFLSWRMSSRQLETVCQRSETPWLGESVKIHIEGTISVRSQQFVLSLSWWSKMNISSRILNRTTCLARAEEWALVHTVLSPGVSVDQRTLGGPCSFMGSGSGRGAAAGRVDPGCAAAGWAGAAAARNACSRGLSWCQTTRGLLSAVNFSNKEQKTLR